MCCQLSAVNATTHNYKGGFFLMISIQKCDSSGLLTEFLLMIYLLHFWVNLNWCVETHSAPMWWQKKQTHEAKLCLGSNTVPLIQPAGPLGLWLWCTSLAKHNNVKTSEKTSVQHGSHCIFKCVAQLQLFFCFYQCYLWAFYIVLFIMKLFYVMIRSCDAVPLFLNI